ncbi:MULTISPECIES: hypothetical protein [Thermoanaerobacterium]|uniref:Uncharacterized protein n=2 Tax=Thermoanaerobacterium TaxID=28895 RepID=W9E804_9THEO|nr:MULTISPECIES: hypothetical protein [Thermoanaerobacterium]AFK87431.1 hypothetical protein Tsac_2433 [Thermoanaerobacterium saccharolyticum JW/SL-YS485]ETO37802.1 hypothetical protein V518_2056 [Thermoanaerobacterium aotearoense SCUT27]
MEKIEFLATLPQIQSAIKIGGDGASRIQFDVPTTEIANVVKLVTATGKLVKVAVEVQEG